MVILKTTDGKFITKGRNQPKKAENTQHQNPSPSTGDYSSSSAMEQALMEKDCVPLTEADLRRWMIRNFWEFKELVLTQCKETTNFEKRYDEMLTRRDNIARNRNELVELKNTTQKISEICTSLNS